MTRKEKRIDKLRALALFALLSGIIYFYFNLFWPARIPFLFKLGIIERPMNVLVVGTDITFDAESGRKNMDKGRTDTIMIIHADPLRNRMNMVSIPRDSYVDIPGYGFGKINAAYILGGIDLTKRTSEKLLGIRIDHYLIINTRGISKLVDLLGGVWVDVEKDMYYVDRAQGLFINIKAGRQKLSGLTAEGFIRFRHDAMADIGRIGRQQQFLSALIKRLANPVSFAKAPFIIGFIRNNIRSNLSIKKFIMLANSARMTPVKNINNLTLPGEAGNNEAGSVILLNLAEVKKLVRENF